MHADATAQARTEASLDQTHQETEVANPVAQVLWITKVHV